jgi:hypothetical protein
MVMRTPGIAGVLVIAGILAVTQPGHAAPPASLLSPRCSKAADTELLAVWPIARTKYFLFFAAFYGEDATTVLSVGRIVIAGADDDAPYDPPGALVANAHTILRTCHRVKVDVVPQGNWHPPIATWTFTDRTGKSFQMTDAEVVFAEVADSLDPPTVRKCANLLMRGKKCFGEGGYSIGDGARVVYKKIAIPNDWQIVDKKWVGGEEPLFQ